MPSADEQWFVVETATRKDAYAQANLERQSFRCFAPRFRKARRHARRNDTVLAPLFPNYLFVHVDPALHPWRSINGTFGVKRLVGGEQGLPRALPECVMQALFARCEGSVMKRAMDDSLPGQRVRLAYGPLVDSLATVESLDDKGRIKVLLRLLERDVLVQVSRDCLLPA